MARNRMIKPEFWSDEKLNKVSRDARLLFIGLWNFADDYGFHLNSFRQILGNVFPLDKNVSEDNIRDWINELMTEKLLIPVKYSDKYLIFVKGWGKHQTVPNKSKRSYIDVSDLEDVIKSALDTNENLISEYLDSHSPKNKEQRTKNKDKDIIVLACERIIKLHPKVRLHNDTLKAIHNAIMLEIENGSTADEAIFLIEQSTKDYAKEHKDNKRFAIDAVKWYSGGGYKSVELDNQDSGSISGVDDDNIRINQIEIFEALDYERDVLAPKEKRKPRRKLNKREAFEVLKAKDAGKNV